jgi:hypothetical protein
MKVLGAKVVLSLHDTTIMNFKATLPTGRVSAFFKAEHVHLARSRNGVQPFPRIKFRLRKWAIDE